MKYRKMQRRKCFYILRDNPEKAGRCNFRKLSANATVKLLILYPELADKVYWNKLKGRNWHFLLTYRPEFIDKYVEYHTANPKRYNPAEWGYIEI